MIIEGVGELPDSVPFAEVVRLLGSLGIDVDKVPALGGVTINSQAIEVHLFAQDPGGHRYTIGGVRSETATHRLIIRVDRSRDFTAELRHAQRATALAELSNLIVQPAEDRMDVAARARASLGLLGVSEAELDAAGIQA